MNSKNGKSHLENGYRIFKSADFEGVPYRINQFWDLLDPAKNPWRLEKELANDNEDTKALINGRYHLFPLFSFENKEIFRVQAKREAGKKAYRVQWEIIPSHKYNDNCLAYKIYLLYFVRKLCPVSRLTSNVFEISDFAEICNLIGEKRVNPDVLMDNLHEISLIVITSTVYHNLKGKEKVLSDYYNHPFEGLVRTDSFAESTLGRQKMEESSQNTKIRIKISTDLLAILNSYPYREMDWDYLKDFSAPEIRFYELVQILRAENHQSHSKTFAIDYAEFANLFQFAPATEMEKANRQLDKFSRRHLEKGYLAKLEVVPALALQKESRKFRASINFEFF